MRPDWTKIRYNDTKINLANNLCYDHILNEKVEKLFKESELEIRQYADEAKVYDVLSNRYSISAINIAIGYGIGELITRLLKLPFKKLAIVSPTWPMTEVYSKIYRLKFTTDVDNNDCDAIYIANPNGVNGTVVPRSEILKLTETYKYVFVDEAYGDFSPIDSSVIKDAVNKNNLVVLKTFSKTLSLAGLRFGYCFSNTEIIKQLQLIRPSCVMSNFIINTVDDLFDMIPGHIMRMTETRTYLQDHFDCDKSNANYVLFNEIPKQIDNTFKTKTLSNGQIRMALTNIDLILKCLN